MFSLTLTVRQKKYLVAAFESLPFIYFSIIIFSHLNFFPIWDGDWYLETLMYAISNNFDLRGFNLVGHTSFLYTLLLAIPQFWQPGNLQLFHLTNLLLGLIAIFSFRKLLPIFCSNFSRTEVTLATFFFAANPLFAASALNFNLDYGALVFFVPFLYFLFKRQYIFVTIFGLFLCFTKETGVIAYFLSIFFYFFYAIYFERLQIKITEFADIILPGILYLFYIFIAPQFNIELMWGNSVWQHYSGSESILESIYNNLSLKSSFLTLLTDLFIINYNWIPSILVLLFLFQVVHSLLQGKNIRNFSKGLFLICVLSPLLIVLAAIPNWANPRYILLAVPIVLLCGLYSLHFVESKKLRMAVLLLVVFGFISSTSFLTDPVTKLVIPTFNFGKHKLLNLTGGQCCGNGRDQLVYNLQYTKMQVLLTELFTYYKHQSEFIVAPFVEWRQPTCLDAVSNRPVYSCDNSRIIKYIDVNTFLSSDLLSSEIIFIEFPNFDSKQSIEALYKEYAISNIREFTKKGYLLRAIEFQKKVN